MCNLYRISVENEKREFYRECRQKRSNIFMLQNSIYVAVALLAKYNFANKRQYKCSRVAQNIIKLSQTADVLEKDCRGGGIFGAPCRFRRRGIPRRTALNLCAEDKDMEFQGIPCQR